MVVLCIIVSFSLYKSQFSNFFIYLSLVCYSTKRRRTQSSCSCPDNVTSVISSRSAGSSPDLQSVRGRCCTTNCMGRGLQLFRKSVNSSTVGINNICNVLFLFVQHFLSLFFKALVVPLSWLNLYTSHVHILSIHIL